MAHKHFFHKDFSSLTIVPRRLKLKPVPCPRIAVITSGGDAPGMNPALRAIVRTALHQGARVYAVKDGYLGLTRGGPDDFKEMFWADVGGIIHIGGTFLGTARSEDFRTVPGRKKVVLNLLKLGINRLIIIGGDGSLTGAQLLFDNWGEFVDEIVENVKNNSDDPENKWYQENWDGREKEIKELHIVGLVGSIDNDMGNTSMTIGCDSALDRICTAVDILTSTATSHRRDFVIEVMGRKCGWLALKAAVACGADLVYIPEQPAEENWHEQLKQTISFNKAREKRSSIIIVAEGAHDCNMQKISAEDIRRVLEEGGSESRVTILGHVQRGGSPSFYDRAHSTLLGNEAVSEMMKGKALTGPQIICVNGLFSTITRPLSECLLISQQIVKCIAEKKFEEALILRGKEFVRARDVMWALVHSNEVEVIEGKHNIGILHVGACSPGMNAITRAIVRLASYKTFATYGVKNGLEGFTTGSLYKLTWSDVNGWSGIGGSKLGTSRYSPAMMNLSKISSALEQFNIKTLMVVGGWDGYECVLYLKSKAHKYPFLQKLNIVMIPCTISNNMPCTQYTIGADTALNSIIGAVDKIKQSAIAQRRIYVIEVMGAHCGFLCSLGAFATGAERAYIPEEGLSLEILEGHLNEVREAFRNHKTMALIFTTEKTSKVFNTKFLAKLYKSYSEDLYDVRVSILGHLQQGGSPSPMDRFLAVEMVGECIKKVELFHKENLSGVVQAVGLIDGTVTFANPDQIVTQMDSTKRRAADNWWIETFHKTGKQYAEWKERPDLFAGKSATR